MISWAFCLSRFSSRLISGMGVGVAGLGAIGAGLGVVGVAGLGFNNAMEQAQARINAFTKDATVTADILEMLRARAAATPFAFEEMTNAAASLLPAATQSGQALEDLIAQAEILAASNPAEGLEGAAFAIKEALGGDFQSVIERFNLSRQSINAMKEEGVPAMEILSRAMGEMGLDAGLVSAMAETAEGRWSTFKDTLTSLAGTITQPIFDQLSTGLGGINEWFVNNESTINAFAANLQTKVADIIGILMPLMQGDIEGALANLSVIQIREGADPQQVVAQFESMISSTDRITEAADRIGAAFGRIFSAEGTDITAVDALVASLNALAGVLERVAAAAETAGQLREIFGAAGAAGGINALVTEATGSERPFASNADLATIATAGISNVPAALNAVGVDTDAITQAILTGFGLAPAPVVTLPPITLDGRAVSEQVSSQLGAQANQIRRAGAAGNF